MNPAALPFSYNRGIHAFLKGISEKWNTNSLNLDLNSDYRFHLLRPWYKERHIFAKVVYSKLDVCKGGNWFN